MIDFIKFPTIRADYDVNLIRKWVRHFPELENAEYIIWEKLHGCNFQVFIDKNRMVCSSRNEVLEPDTKFYGYQNMVEEYDEVWDTFKSLSVMTGETYRIYGEYFGRGIMSGVDYGDRKRFKIFSIYANDKRLDPKHMIEILENLKLSHMLCPILGIVKGLQNALDFDIKINSHMSDKEDNLIEGIVIIPYVDIRFDGNGSCFSLKKKNDKFKERATKTRTIVDDKPEEIQELRAEFQSFITKPRADNIMSKFGMIDDSHDVGKYIKYLIEDARSEFLEEFDIKSLTKDEMKYIFNAGKIASEIIFDYLKRGNINE